MQGVKSYIKKLDNVGPHTTNIKSFCTCMPILPHSTLNHSSKGWNKIDRIIMLDLLKYLLKNSVFKFGDWVHTQLHGIAMDTKLASTLYIAAIYIDDLEEVFIGSQKVQPDVYTNAHMYTCMHLCTCMQRHTQTHKHIHMHIQTNRHTYTQWQR